MSSQWMGQSFTRRYLTTFASTLFLAACGSSSIDGTAAAAPGNPTAAGGAPAGAALPDITLQTWTTTAPMPGTPTSYSRAVAVNGQLFVLGGRTLNTGVGAGQPQLGVLAYDPKADSWAEHEPLPKLIDQPNVAGIQGKIYVLGGKDVLTIFEYDPGTRVWSEKGQRPVAVGIGASAVAVKGDEIFLAGGVVPSATNPRGARVTDFASYNVRTGAWQTLPTMVEESAYFGAEILGNSLYTFGGSTEQREVARPGKTFAFDFTSKLWTEKALLPLAVSSFASASVGTRTYIIGGITGATGRINPETQVYDSVADSWGFTTNLPTPRFALGAVALGGKIYVPGGVQQTGEATFDAVPIVEVLSP